MADRRHQPLAEYLINRGRKFFGFHEAAESASRCKDRGSSLKELESTGRMAHSERLSRKAFSIVESDPPESPKAPSKRKSITKMLFPSLLDRRRKSTSEVAVAGPSHDTASQSSHKHTPAPSNDEVRRRSITPMKTVADELGLDQKGVNLLKASWKVLKGSLQEIGIEIFQAIFEQCPEVKDVFMFDNSTAGGCNKEMECHAKRYMDVFQTALDHLEKPHTSLVIILNNLGHVHYRWKERGIRPYYWSVFQMTTITVTLSKLSSDFHLTEIRDAWTKLVEMVVHEMKNGYAQAQAKTVSVRSQSICAGAGGSLLQPPSPTSNPRNRRRSSCSVPTVAPLHEDQTNEDEEQNEAIN